MRFFNLQFVYMRVACLAKLKLLFNRHVTKTLCLNGYLYAMQNEQC